MVPQYSTQAEGDWQESLESRQAEVAFERLLYDSAYRDALLQRIFRSASSGMGPLAEAVDDFRPPQDLPF